MSKLVALTFVAISIVGCGGEAAPKAEPSGKATAAATSTAAATGTASAKKDDSGW